MKPKNSNKHPEVLKSEDLLLWYRSGDRETWVTNFIKDREFRLGEQFDQEVKQAYENKGLLAAAINETLPATDQIIADLTTNAPRFTAIATEDSDVKVASYVAFLFDWIYYISKGESKVERFVRDFCEGGVGAIMVYPDYEADNGKGEIKIKDLDPIKVYLDPTCQDPDGSDSANIIYSDIFSEEVILSNWDIDLTYAEQESSNEYSRQGADTQGQVIFANRPSNTKYYRIIERFTKIKVPRYHVYDPISNFETTFEEKEKYNEWREEVAIIVVEMNGESYVTDDIRINKYLEIYNTFGDTYHLMFDQNGQQQIVPGVEHDSPYVVPNSTTQLKLVTKGELVDQGVIELTQPRVTRIRRVFSIGGVLVVNEVLPLSNYPIVTSMLHHNRNPYASGDIRLIRPLQEQLNILDSRIQAYLRMITTLRAFTNKGGGLKKKLDEKGDPMGMEVYEVDMESANGGVIFPNYPQLPAGIMAQRENIIRQIQRIIGAYSFQDGEATSAPRTASGTSMVDEFMRRRSAYKKRKIEASLNQLAKAISEYVPYMYRERKLIRMMTPQNREIIINEPQEENGEIKLLNDVTTYKFDVRMISGSMLPSNREQERAELMRAYELGMIKDPKWWLEKMNFEDTEEVIQTEGLVNQLQGMVQQMEQRIKDLEGSLQRKVNENIQLQEKVAVEKTKSNLDRLKNKTEANVLLTQARLNDEVKKEKQNGRENSNE